MTLDHSSTAEDSAASAQAVPQSGLDTPDAETHKFVSFFVGENHYAISARAVLEVTARLMPTPLPDCPTSLLGVTPHRGDILAVVQPEGLDCTGGTGRRKTIILRPVGDGVEIPVAFTVDRIGEVVQFASADIRHTSGGDPIADFEGTFNGNSIRIIDPTRIAGLVAP